MNDGQTSSSSFAFVELFGSELWKIISLGDHPAQPKSTPTESPCTSSNAAAALPYPPALLTPRYHVLLLLPPRLLMYPALPLRNDTRVPASRPAPMTYSYLVHSLPPPSAHSQYTYATASLPPPSVPAQEQSQPSPPPASLTPPQMSPTKRKHICQTCERGFTTSGHLARHTRIHTGERNHKCPFPGCETRCSRQDNLQQQ
ncbi:uncharacterized protein LAESUDRAFT_756314 [Laetiporus sulphureus 93-53]|uniref:C2H2-type domain-containing protein n=1 Tax=Laetiporus sulphureus 93-53 TaxID=1314785 RepID=A0A165GBM7_9APHY|nr:uncharacterized protein LAESUDRAFT_756314 [Laetiporus sulphureus 93-53]KZT10120.1 hypothetical protein LAESUDRAFT_756314 [Laetiporus sulphureus 93-53]